MTVISLPRSTAHFQSILPGLSYIICYIKTQNLMELIVLQKKGDIVHLFIVGLIWHLKEQLIIIELSQFQKPDGY